MYCDTLLASCTAIVLADTDRCIENSPSNFETIAAGSHLHYTWEDLMQEPKVACISLPNGAELCETVFSEISSSIRKTLQVSISTMHDTLTCQTLAIDRSID
jgi:hypothetical protein